MKDKIIEEKIREFQNDKGFFFKDDEGYLIPNPSPETLAFMKRWIRTELEKAVLGAKRDMLNACEEYGVFVARAIFEDGGV